ncbi:MAG: PD-(D/E)XK nuclease family protein [Elusimicrobiaceae bacterium]|nr:PD-(D/E)XK nuclease family protein [Elusimicrobiaceae bacterium]
MTQPALGFSYSRMGMYKECPKKYEFRYIYRIPEKPKPYFAFGHSIHHSLEYLYSVTTPPFPTLTELLDFFEKDWKQLSWQDKGYQTAEKEYAAFLDGKKMLIAYYNKHKDTFHIPLANEIRASLKIDGLSLLSIIDRIDYLGDGKLRIVDYKTGKTIQREPDQLYMYQKVLEASEDIKKVVQKKDKAVKEIQVAEMVFYYVPTLKEIKFERGSDKVIFDFWQTVLDVANDIRAKKFEPTPSERTCRWCDYKNICPVFGGKGDNKPETQSLGAEVNTDKEITAEENLANKIEEYATTLQNAKILKEEIISLMKLKKVESFDSKHFTASFAKKEILNFEDKEKVMKFLKEEDLLSKTLVPTQSTIEGLMTDDKVSKEQKDKLSSFAKKIESIKIVLSKLKK